MWLRSPGVRELEKVVRDFATHTHCIGTTAQSLESRDTVCHRPQSKQELQSTSCDRCKLVCNHSLPFVHLPCAQPLDCSIPLHKLHRHSTSSIPLRSLHFLHTVQELHLHLTTWNLECAMESRLYTADWPGTAPRLDLYEACTLKLPTIMN